MGSGGCGAKSSLVIKYMQDTYVTKYDPTIEDSYLFAKQWQGINVVIDAADTAGVEEYSALTDVYAKSCPGGFIMGYNMTSITSFEHIVKKRECVVRLQNRPAELIPMVVVAHKADRAAERQVSRAEGIELASKWGVPYFETSALTGQNVSEAFEALGQEIDRIDALRVIDSCTKVVPVHLTTTPHGSTYTGNILVPLSPSNTTTTQDNNNDNNNGEGGGGRGQEVLNPHTQGQVVYAAKDNPIIQSYDGGWCCGRKEGIGLAVLRSNNNVAVNGVWRHGQLVQMKGE
eukprot:TRINITY_DN3105_c0_g1_i3.p1 TRINITY_DN3105_c0_g1~~TRINITY_DN3105_c0_g1_i3.p1  ORF type:complete len:288 (-),score=63.25 TRINITY_DN3105_c0_g1_i3:41-904(-)